MFGKIISHLIYLHNYKKSKGTSRLYKQGGEQMKIQYIAVIFLLIALPILLVVSYYMGLQIDTITLQTTYNTKLLASTKEALEAFEINTVEWNSQYSDVANSRRRNVEAAINTFTRSLANNLGISGANKEYLEAYLPAVLCTMYDGYYIYTPTDMKETVKDANGQDVVTEEGDIVYKARTGGRTITVDSIDYHNATDIPANAEEKKEHTLLPYVEYSEQIGDITVAYTLDNYIKVYGKFSSNNSFKNYGGDKAKLLKDRLTDTTSYYVQEEGYLLDFDGSDEIEEKKIGELEYNGTPIYEETLTENVAYKDDAGVYHEEEFAYIYIEDSQGDKTKLYYTTPPLGYSNNWFTINTKDERVFLTDSITNVTQYVYKKVSLPGIKIAGTWNDPNGVSMQNRYINFYQVLNGETYDSTTGNGEKGKWYADWNDDGKLTPSEKVSDTIYYSEFNLGRIDLWEDCSAIKYYVQAYYFTKWVNSKVTEKLPNSNDDLGFSYKNDIFKINATNDPGNPEIAKDSAFYQHKNQIIQDKIMDSLAQAIYYYEDSSGQLPNPTGEEWEQILSNVSMVSFMQGVPIGLKTYNSYAIATSTNNREYVDPNEIYFINIDDDYYHRCYCDKTVDSMINTMGYRSIDFIEKNYEIKTDETTTTKYYFLHNGAGPIDKIKGSMACYYCLVNRANMVEYVNIAYTDAYNTALARERYRSKQDVILAKEYAEFTVDKAVASINGSPTATYAEVGDTIEWKITVKNVGKVEGKVNVYDKLPNGLNLEGVSPALLAVDSVEDKVEGTLTIGAGVSVELIVTTTVESIASLGEIVNTVIIKDETGDIKIDTATAYTYIEQEIELTTSTSGGGSGEGANIILVADCSWSMIKFMDGTPKITGVRNVIKNILLREEFYTEDGSPSKFNLAIVPFAALTTGTGGTIISPSNFTVTDKYSGSECVKWSKLKQELTNKGENYLRTKAGVHSITSPGTNYHEAFEATAEHFDKMKNQMGLNGDNYVIFISDGCPTTTFTTEDAKDWIAGSVDGRGWLTWLPFFDFPAWIVSVIGSVIEVRLNSVDEDASGNPTIYHSDFKLAIVGDLGELVGDALKFLGINVSAVEQLGWMPWGELINNLFPGLAMAMPSDWKQIIENGYDGVLDGVNNSTSTAKGGVFRLHEEYGAKIFTIAFDSSDAKPGLDYIAKKTGGQSYEAANYEELYNALMNAIGQITGGPEVPTEPIIDHTSSGKYDLGDDKVLVKLIVNNDEVNHSYDKATLESKGWKSGNILDIRKMKEELKSAGVTLTSVKVIYY